MTSYESSALKIVNLMSNNASEYVNGPEKKLQILKTFFEASDLKDIDKEALLIQAGLNEKAFQYISLIDMNGFELFCSEPYKKFKNISKMESFKFVLEKNESFKSSVYISSEHYPILIEIMPVIKMGELRYVIYAEINLNGIWEYIDELSKTKAINFFIVSSKGIICSYKDKKILLKHEDKKSKMISSYALKSYINPVVVSLSKSEKYLLCSDKIRDLDYYLVYQQDVAAILKDINKINTYLLISSTIIIFFSFILVKKISVKISDPILKLVHNIQFIGEKHIDRNLLIEKRIDEIGKLYRAFYDMNEKVLESKARERLAIIGESAVGISHEVKNPITAIKNFIHLVIDNPKDEHIFNKFKIAVPKEISRIENMLEDLSHLSLGKKLNKTLCNVENILNNIFLLFERELKEKNIQIIKTFNIKNNSLMLDEEKIISVFINLIKNSIFSINSDGRINIKIQEFEIKQKKLIIIFEDTGSGISPLIISNIFNPFFTTKKKGLGVGLAISKGIIEQHGGTITAESEGLGKGATFIITLPI